MIARENQLDMFIIAEEMPLISVGDVKQCNLPCPELMMSSSSTEENFYRTGCYNYWKMVQVMAIISDNRAICRDVEYLSISNHNGWTIVPFQYLGDRTLV